MYEMIPTEILKTFTFTKLQIHVQIVLSILLSSMVGFGTAACGSSLIVALNRWIGQGRLALLDRHDNLNHDYPRHVHMQLVQSPPAHSVE